MTVPTMQLKLPTESFIVVGTSESDDVDISDARGDYDVWVIKLNPEGQLLWEKSLGGSAYDGANAVVLDGNENIYILGHTLSQDAGYFFTNREC